MWCNPNGSKRRSKVPKRNGAKKRAVSWELAIHIPKLLIPYWITGQIIAKTNATTVERQITTKGTNRLPLKNDKASGNLRKL